MPSFGGSLLRGSQGLNLVWQKEGNVPYKEIQARGPVCVNG